MKHRMNGFTPPFSSVLSLREQEHPYLLPISTEFQCYVLVALSRHYPCKGRLA
jgi:hypothetical protein